MDDVLGAQRRDDRRPTGRSWFNVTMSSAVFSFPSGRGIDVPRELLGEISTCIASPGIRCLMSAQLRRDSNASTTQMKAG